MLICLSPVTSVPSFIACFFAGVLPFRTAGMYFSNCFRKAPVCTLSSRLFIISFCSAFNGCTNSLITSLLSAASLIVAISFSFASITFCFSSTVFFASSACSFAMSTTLRSFAVSPFSFKNDCEYSC